MNYPKPHQTGGGLIRNIIAFIRSNHMLLPIDSHIHIAISGGSDSVALAHLLVHYGRKISSKKQLTLFHINHHWRGEESDKDAEFSRKLAKQWGVPFLCFDLAHSETFKGGGSYEETWRLARKKIFSELTQQPNTMIFTAHHADDLAETLLWRLFTGSALTHGGGILFREGPNGNEIRPLLTIRKEKLKDYLKEEGVSWCEDSTNLEGRFLRSQMRSKLTPQIEKLFPRAVEQLVQQAIHVQTQIDQKAPPIASSVTPDLLFSAAALKARRIHWNILQNRNHLKHKRGSLDLPNHWKLSWERDSCAEKWSLEKTKK